MKSPVKVRFAPSPTGPLHIGGARTAVYNILFSHINNGKTILRIDDTDPNRSKIDFEKNILNALKWLNLNFDEIIKQSERFDIYKKYAKILIDKKLAYRKDGAIFFKAEKKDVSFDDFLRGKISFNKDQIEDFVIIRSNNYPTYLFSSVVDDGEMGITHIIRGEDHIPNTYKQIMLFNALDFKTPQFLHLPLILNEKGEKLSKRNESLSVLSLKNSGFLPDGLLNAIILLGWTPKNGVEIFTFEECKKMFNPKWFTKNPARFSMEKFLWINGQHIKKQTPEYLLKNMKDIPSISRKIKNYEEMDKTKLLSAINILKQRPKTIIKLYENLYYFFEKEIEIPNSLLNEINKNQIFLSSIGKIYNLIKEIKEFKACKIENVFRNFCAENNIGTKEIFIPLRIVLTGQKVTPSLFEVIETMGKELCMLRIKKFNISKQIK